MRAQITLQGVVLPVGGVRDKLLAAHRGGVRRVILPRRNMRDLKDVPVEVREQLELIPVTRIEEVLVNAFAGGYTYVPVGGEFAPGAAPAAPAAAAKMARVGRITLHKASL